jgi:hypothetical protein
MPDAPSDPITPLLESATQIHEMFLAWQKAGFTEAQAFELVRTAIGAMFKGAGGG